MVVALGAGEDVVWGEAIEVGLAGEVSPEPADGVFDATLLPGSMRVAEEGFDVEAMAQLVM